MIIIKGNQGKLLVSPTNNTHVMEHTDVKQADKNEKPHKSNNLKIFLVIGVFIFKLDVKKTTRF